MNINELEKTLCRLYRKSYDNQKIDIDYQNRRESFRLRVKNLDRQYAHLDMRALCEKHGI